MAIKWKRKYRPDLILAKIDAARTISSEGRVSFSGFDIYQCLPVLASMLDLPDVAKDMNKSSLLWSALAKAKGNLDKTSVNIALNDELNTKLEARVDRYFIVTSLSVASKGFPKSMIVRGARIEFCRNGLSKAFSRTHTNKAAQSLPIQTTPSSYLPIRISVEAKSHDAAAKQALYKLDLIRGLIALYENHAMQFDLGGSSPFQPINKVRCGGWHTVHSASGALATEAVWYEPNFVPAKCHSVKNPETLIAFIRKDILRIKRSNYSEPLIDAIVRYARAFDESDPNTAFIKLWSALETLTTPNVANYDNMVNRCSFLYAESEYHRQVLLHLRDYRNSNIHAGIESDGARTNCFLLQEYFRSAIHFYKGNYADFATLEAANEFLDLPQNKDVLASKISHLRKAMKFITPKSA